MSDASESDSAPAPRKSGGGKKGLGKYKNLIMLGGGVVAAYFLYELVIKKFLAGGDSGGPSKGDSGSGMRNDIPPDMHGPLVYRNAPASSASPICVSQQETGLIYAKVIRTDAQGNNTFIPQHNGHFTRRFLCTGGGKWAEIRPKI